MITFDQTTKTYEGDVTAVKGVDFTVEEGQIVVLLGPSGCGKTTLLRMVNRLETISKGKIMIDGQDSMALDQIELRRQIGYVIQSNGLFPNMTIEENVMIVPDLLGWNKKEKKTRFNKLMEMIGLSGEEFGKRYPHELSGGQQQRIGVIRALAADPPVMNLLEHSTQLSVKRSKMNFSKFKKKLRKRSSL
ncbi:ATP-binding cassette domain-containing protein [Pseudalkalibacillus hwajinpoensis]|uniref:ATP-binding cassette domain-containing protein n=1 Tax=Guptibacillus hwajinpoensis TaxID=208199 RepID=UPI00325BDD81